MSDGQDRGDAPVDSNQARSHFDQGKPDESGGQAFHAHALRKVTKQPGQSPRGFGADSDLLFEQAMGQTRMAICLSDPHRKDDPIVFANRAFLELTGYEAEDVVGRNCRFLQGPETDREEVGKITAALREESVAVVELINYRKDGSKFWNALHIGPIYDDAGALLYYFGSQWDVTDVHAARANEQQQRLLARELSHRMKNMFAVINAVVSMAGRESPEARAIGEKISGRIMALGRAHEATLVSASRTEPADLRPLLREVLSAYGAGDRLEMSGEDARLDSNVVSMLALTIHELAINATKHGALSAADGTVAIDWSAETNEDGEDVLVLSWTERGGPEIESPPASIGLGSGIVAGLIRAADGRIDFDWDRRGLGVTLRLPLADD